MATPHKSAVTTTPICWSSKRNKGAVRLSQSSQKRRFHCQLLCWPKDSVVLHTWACTKLWQPIPSSHKSRLKEFQAPLQAYHWWCMTHLKGTYNCSIPNWGMSDSRPLMPLIDPEDGMEVLTPGNFLIGAPLEALPNPQVSFHHTSLLRHWHLCQTRGSLRIRKRVAKVLRPYLSGGNGLT